jgi:hypothetical protein
MPDCVHQNCTIDFVYREVKSNGAGDEQQETSQKKAKYFSLALSLSLSVYLSPLFIFFRNEISNFA